MTGPHIEREDRPLDLRSSSGDVPLLIAAMTLRLRVPWAHSLKEKRAVVKSLISRLQNRFHVSAAEIGGLDTHQLIVIGVAAVVPHRAMADSLMEEISAFAENDEEAELLEETRELR